MNIGPEFTAAAVVTSAGDVYTWRLPGCDKELSWAKTSRPSRLKALGDEGGLHGVKQSTHSVPLPTHTPTLRSIVHAR